MKRILLAVVVLVAILFADAPFGGPKLNERPLFAKGIVKFQLTDNAFNSGMLKIDNSSKSYSVSGIASIDKLNQKHFATNLKTAFMEPKNREMAKDLGFDRWMMVNIPDDSDVMAVVEDYKNDPNVESANPEYYLYATSVPSDPYHSYHWGHNNTAQMLQYITADGNSGIHTGDPVGTVGFDTNAQAGWDGSQGYGSSTVIIGIIDSGVDTGHEDINDVAGYDFGDNDTNPMDNSAQAGHGTCCAGAAAGIAGNNKGVAGTAGGCKIMPLKIADSAGSMSFTAITNAVNWGADNGAHVLSMSLGAGVSPGYDDACDAAMLYAYNSGCILLAATGNENATSISYPANHANVLGVGAAAPDNGRKNKTSIDGEYWWGSNYGSTTPDAANAVDFIAPCIIPTTDISGTAGYQSGDYYIYFNGTSSATPYAAGFAALIKSKYPTYTPAQIASLMKSTCIDIDDEEATAGFDKYTGYGLIDLQAALNPGGTPPGVPTLVSPTNGSTVADLTPTFDWNDVTDATSYTILVDNTSNFSSPEINVSPTTSTYTPASNLAAGTYYWKVLATNSSGSSAYCAYWSVTLTAPLPLPDVPVLVSPTNGSTVEDLTPTFDWNDAANATGYHIQICTNKQMTTIIYNTTTAVSNFTPPSNLAEVDYYWWVSSINATGESAFSAYRIVTVVSPPPPPPAPTLISPANGSGTTDTTPSFDWSDASGATGYEILVDNNADFSTPNINTTTVSSDYTAVSALTNGTYYWKVRGTNLSGAGTYSSTWSFSIGAAPGVPVLALPANGSLTTDLTPTFDWNDVTDATSYTILVDNNSDFSTPEINQSPTLSTYTPAANLAVGTYYWKVLATNIYGSSAYSGSWTVSLGNPPAVPTLATPTNGSGTTDQTPTFDWNDVAGATSYTILVDNDVAFGSPEITNSPMVSTYTPAANLAYGTYYWKVLATNAYGSSAYCTAWSFTVQAPLPGAPTLISPANGSGSTDTTPAFDWSDDAYATGYEIMVDNNSNFGSPEINTTSVSSDYTAVSTLAVGTYYWKVRSTNGTGSSAYTTAWTFTVQSPANISLSVASINTTAAPEGTDTDSFNILNSGDVNLDYTITKEYVAKKADATAIGNNFDTELGWISSGNYQWLRNTGTSNLDGTPFARSISLKIAASSSVLTSPTFDGSVCTELYVDFDQSAQLISNKGNIAVEYSTDNGTNWNQIYYIIGPATIGAWSNPDHQRIQIPNITNQMKIRFTLAVNNVADFAWNLDNIVVSGPAAGPVYTWLTINSSLTGLVAPAGSNTISLTCDAAGLAEGTYNANVTIASNDPDEPSKVLPVEFIVYQATVIPGVPSNVVTSISGTDLVIDWDVAADATSYDVYSADDPYGTFTYVTNVPTNQYTIAYTAAKKFYYVVAKNATK